VQSGYLALEVVRKMAATESTIERLRLQRGDVLVVEGNSFEEVGRAALWLGDAETHIIQNSVLRVRVAGDDLLPEFVVAWMNSGAGRAFVRRKATTTSGSLWHIGVGKLSNAPIPVRQQMSSVRWLKS
jgi:type I restriction enzyme, S subunit